MKKQTAVEWLVEQFDLTSDSPIIKNVVNQAKAMEKEQIIDSFIGFDSDTDENIEIAQAYYKEFYGK
jgi:hypothetical protein